MTMNKKLLIWGGAILLLVLTLIIFVFNGDEESSPLLTTVRKGTFVHEVIISGEAQSKSQKNIEGPKEMSNYNIRSLKIQDLIPEGTVVKKGDYVGRLDPGPVSEKLNNEFLNLEGAQAKYTQKKLDTTLSLKQERTKIANIKFDLEEKQLELERSVYEPPSTIRQLEITVEKLKRSFEEGTADYDIKKRKATAEMIEVGAEVSKIQKRIEGLQKLFSALTVYSPDDGMVTYARLWNGAKKVVGSDISPWSRELAALPNLNKMESKTFANEVDIRKIEKGLSVKVGFDAFPELEIKGEVTDVANVGEKKRGSDVKLFQVMVNIVEENDKIRPGMTTSNRILINSKEDVLMIPIESIFAQDSTNYVYTKSNFSVLKKEVIIGDMNNSEAIVEKGLTENEALYLSEPEGMEDEPIQLLK